LSIEGEFVRFTPRARNQLAFVRDSIDAGYLDDIHRFEVLDRDQEYEFARRWREHGDRDAAHQLAGAISVLNDRERRIFEARHLADEPLTLEDLAAEFNVSRDRIRQIETRAFEKVRKAALKRAAEAAAAMSAHSGVLAEIRSADRV